MSKPGEYTKVNAIGHGSSSRVWSVYKNGDPDKQELALKASSIRSSKQWTGEDLKELDVLKQLKHAHILQYHAFFINSPDGFQVSSRYFSRDWKLTRDVF